jgi:hypothetical protein
MFLLALLLNTGSAAAQDVTVELQYEDPLSVGRMVTAPQRVRLERIEGLGHQVRWALRDAVWRGALDPAITGRNAAPVQAVALEVGKDGDAVGKAKLSWRLDEIQSAVDLILKGPITGTAGVPLTDRGLASGASATVGYSLALWTSEVAPATADTLGRFAIPSETPMLDPLEAVIAAGLAAAEGPENRNYLNPTLRLMVSPEVRAAFLSGDPRRIAHALQRRRIATQKRTLALRGSYGVGSTTFTFVELPDLRTEINQTEKETSFAVDVAYVQLLRDGDAEAPLLLASAGYTSSERWQQGRSAQICTPLETTAATECVSAIIGKPKARDEETFEIDLRSWVYSQKLGLNPHVSYDRTTKRWSSELNLSYLVLSEPANGLPQLDAKALTVGVRVGKRPDDDGGVYALVYFASVLSR